MGCCLSEEERNIDIPDLNGERDEPQNLILDKYHLSTSAEDLLGYGRFSMCYRSTHASSGAVVAVKVCNATVSSDQVALRRFRRQIAVLRELQRPLAAPGDPRYWHKRLEHVHPEEVFVQLLDYSCGVDGEAGIDPRDGALYTVTDIAQESLQSFISRLRAECAPPPSESVRSIAKAIVLVAAALHSKDLIHLDLKPANVMLFGDRIKLIDVDGCLRALSPVSLYDESISFSLGYCAPEWARWIYPSYAGEIQTSTLQAEPSLDAWSLGLILCELVTLEAALNREFSAYQRRSGARLLTRREDDLAYLEWLSGLEKPPVPSVVRSFDPELHAFASMLLSPQPPQRGTLAEKLSDPYLTAGGRGVCARFSAWSPVMLKDDVVLSNKGAPAATAEMLTPRTLAVKPQARRPLPNLGSTQAERTGPQTPPRPSESRRPAAAPTPRVAQSAPDMRLPMVRAGRLPTEDLDTRVPYKRLLGKHVSEAKALVEQGEGVPGVPSALRVPRFAA